MYINYICVFVLRVAETFFFSLSTNIPWNQQEEKKKKFVFVCDMEN